MENISISSRSSYISKIHPSMQNLMKQLYLKQLETYSTGYFGVGAIVGRHPSLHIFGEFILSLNCPKISKNDFIFDIICQA